MRPYTSSTARLLLVASMIFGALLVTRPARAEVAARVAETSQPADTAAAGKSAPFDPFGTTGTRALALAIDIGAANSGLPTHPLGMGVRTTLDAFVVDHLSIGASFGFEYSGDAGTFYNIGGGPRVGYALRLGKDLALWPTLTVTYDAGNVPMPPMGSGTWSLQDLRVGAQLPLLLTLGGQVALELGPVASTDIWRSVNGQDATRMDLLGLRTGIIGWF